MKKKILYIFLLILNGFIYNALLTIPVGLLMGMLIRVWYVVLIVFFFLACLVFRQIGFERSELPDNTISAPVVILCTRLPSVIVGAAIWVSFSPSCAWHFIAAVLVIAFTLTSATMLAASLAAYFAGKIKLHTGG